MLQEELDLLMEETKEGMSLALEHLQKELTHVKAGKATPAMVDGLKVSYYGTPTLLNQVSNVTTSDAKTLVIQPWEKTMLSVIEKAIFEANLGVTPMNDGEVIRLVIPPLTEERRRDLVKRVKSFGEEAKVGLRSVRHKSMDAIKKAVKDGYPEDAGKRLEGNVQQMVDDFSKKIDLMTEAKEKEIMTV
ncbi:MAG: ribosome recycling factor [Saprospirales bacterium]|nr:ribosome recycling factor [Saprospirales bacterium]MBK8489622.1 ribosome recycling factor [Saprospirales bacterium]